VAAPQANRPSPLQLLLQLKHRVADVQAHPYQVADAHVMRASSAGAPSHTLFLPRTSTASSAQDKALGTKQDQIEAAATRARLRSERARLEQREAAIEARRWRGQEAVRLKREISHCREHVALKCALDKGLGGGLSGELLERRNALIDVPPVVTRTQKDVEETQTRRVELVRVLKSTLYSDVVQ
jgi:hypothetical protein